MRSNLHYGKSRVSRFFFDGRQEDTAFCSRLNYGFKNSCRNAALFYEVETIISLVRVKERACRCYGVLACLFSREHIVEKVGHMEKALGVFHYPWSVTHIGSELIRIEVKRLYACFRVNFLFCGKIRENIRLNIVGALVSVVIRIGEENTRFVEITVVHSPCVNTHRNRSALMRSR